MERSAFIAKINKAFEVHPIVAILGPRQCGKTTVARQYAVESKIVLPRQNYFDLENINDLARLEHPLLTLSTLDELVVIDEIQKIPNLFPTLRVLADEPGNSKRFLILGSASRELIRQTSETLAGRIQYLELTPFSCTEVPNLQPLLLRGGFPLSYLASTDENSETWRQAYIKTFLEQDIPSLGIQVAPQNLRRFWMMLAHYHGNIWNASELARALNISQKTANHYIDILVGTFMIRSLQPWYENISKRQVKSPKIYFRDIGIFHSLIGITTLDTLLTHPKLGASWEGFALEEIIRYHQADPSECYFWATHADAELDLLIIKNGKRLGFEFKYTDRPTLTKSMRIAIDDLRLDALTIISPGQHDFPLPNTVRACGLENYLRIPQQ